MAKTVSPAKTLMLIVGVLAAAFMSTGCSKSITVSINLVNGFEIPALGEFVAGDPIPEDLDIPTLPLCGPLPSRDDLEGLLEAAVGPLFALFIHIESVELVDKTLTAANGNFEDITYFGMFWQPSPVESVSQPEVDLGHATSALGFDSPLVLTPAATVDFLTLLDNESDNPEGECPGLGMRIAGSVPAAEDMPEIDVQIRVRITGRIGS
jgi:hypothetical protein